MCKMQIKSLKVHLFFKNQISQGSLILYGCSSKHLAELLNILTLGITFVLRGKALLIITVLLLL